MAGEEFETLHLWREKDRPHLPHCAPKRKPEPDDRRGEMALALALRLMKIEARAARTPGEAPGTATGKRVLAVTSLAAISGATLRTVAVLFDTATG